MSRHAAFVTIGLVTCFAGGSARPAAATDARDRTDADAVGVDVEVKRGPLVDRLSFQGELQSTQSIAIHAPDIPDLWYLTIESVLEDGKAVKKGEVVMTFRSGELTDDLSGLRDAVLVAEAEKRSVEFRLDAERIDLELQVSRREMQLERAKLMVVEGVNLISKLELQKAQLDVQTAELELKRAGEARTAFASKRDADVRVQTLRLDSAKRQLAEKSTAVARMQVTAPADGVVYAPFVQLNDEKGKAAPGKVARPGSKLLELPDLGAFQAHLYVRQRDAARLRPGDPAKLFLTVAPDQTLAAKVASKETFAMTRNERLGTKVPEGNLKEIHVILEVLAPTPGLRPGSTLRADVETALGDEVLQVPLAAVAHTGETASVVLANGDHRTVTLGRTTATVAEVLTGLEAGERVRLE